jgi:simple sugar transport system ATP-binding protein
MPPYAERGRLLKAGGDEAAGRMAARFNTKLATLDQAIGGLSGGNQQRFVAGRALDGAPKLIVAFQPARGLDLKATREVYDAIRQACREGAAALIVSFDLDELLAHCDRVLAMNRGQLYSPEADASRDRNEIGRLMVAT